MMCSCWTGGPVTEDYILNPDPKESPLWNAPVALTAAPRSVGDEKIELGFDNLFRALVAANKLRALGYNPKVHVGRKENTRLAMDHQH